MPWDVDRLTYGEIDEYMRALKQLDDAVEKSKGG
jgi:hypothetical protein